MTPAQIQSAIRENRRLGHEVTEGLLSDLYRMAGDDAMYRAARNYAWRQNGTEVLNGRRQLKASSAGIGPDFVKLVALAQKTKLALPATGIIDTRTESIGGLFLRNRPAMIQSAIEDIAKNIELIQFRPARSAIATRLQSMNGAELRDVIGGLTVRFPRHRESASFALWLYNRLPEFRTEMEVILSSAGLLEPILWQEARRILAKPGAEEASQLLLKRQGAQLHILLGALLQRRSPRVAATFLFEEVLSDRLAQEKVRQHFFTQGGVALQFAVEQTAARIVDRIDGYTGLADSYDVAWSFRTTPAAHRNTVLSTLDELTRAKWGQSAAVALNEDINETAYNQIRTALGVRLPPFDPTLKSAAAKAADVLEYGVIAVEVVSGVLAGIVTGVAMFLWDFVGLAIDLIKLGYYLNMSLFYWLTFGAIGQSEWIAVRDGTLGIIEGLKDPGALFKEAWAQTVSNADTIGGPFEYFRRAEYWTRLIIYFLLTVVTIVKGLIRGGQTAARWAARQRQMARFRRLAGAAEDVSHTRPPGKPTRPGAADGGSPERPTLPGDGPAVDRPLTDTDTQVPVAEVTKRQIIEIQVGAHELRVTANGLVYICSPTCRQLGLIIDNLVETNFLAEGEVFEIRQRLNAIRRTTDYATRENRARALGRSVSHLIDVYNAEIQPIINVAKWKQILFVRPGMRRLDATALREGRLRHLAVTERQAALVEVTSAGDLKFASGPLIDTNTGKKWLFVLEPNGNIYVFEELTGINHTSILQGRAVSAAGEIRVRNGVLMNVNDQSGHYYPKLDNMRQLSNELAQRGIAESRIIRAGLPRPD